MSRMSDVDILCKDISLKAQHAMDAGEKIQDISDAIFEQVFNTVGRTPETRDWAMNTANGIVAKLVANEGRDKDLVKMIPDLIDCLKWATSFAETQRNIQPVLDNPCFNAWLDDCNRQLEIFSTSSTAEGIQSVDRDG